MTGGYFRSSGAGRRPGVRGILQRIEQVGITVHIIDAPAKQKEFSDQHAIDYPLLSDEDGAVTGVIGVARGGLLGRLTPVKRWTFAIGTDRRVVKVISSQTNMTRHADEALRAFG